MGRTKELILVHHAMQRVFLTDSVNIMLTPEFYTLKKERISVKYTYQAKRIAHSLFMGLLEEGREYEYMVWKEGDEWVFIAYDTQKIAEFLETKGFTFSQVAKVFFAQQSLALFEGALAVGENKVLVAIDAVMVLLPRAILRDEERPSLVFSNRFTPKIGASLQSSHSSYLSLPHTIILTIFLILFAIIFVFEGYSLKNRGGEANIELEALYEAHSSLSSSYTRKGILDKYQRLDKKERQKRETIKIFSTIIFKGVTLSSLKINEKKFKALFACKDKATLKRVKALAKKHNMTSRVVAGTNDVIIEGNL